MVERKITEHIPYVIQVLIGCFVLALALSSFTIEHYYIGQRAKILEYLLRTAFRHAWLQIFCL